MIFTTETMKEMLRPVVADAAGSLASGGYLRDEAEALEWFDSASVEALQETIMYAVQRGILFALDLAPLPDMDGVATYEEREATE